MKRKPTRTSQTAKSLAVVGLVILAIAAGYVGGKLGGDNASEAVRPGSWIDEIKDRGELRVGCADAPPTIVVQSDSSCTGPDLVPLERFARDIGVKLTTKATTWQNIVAGLQANLYDIAADLDQTVERTLSIQFTDPSWSYPGVYLVKRNSGLDTSAKIAAAPRPPSATQGSANDRALQAVGIMPMRVDTYQNAANAVTAGRASSVFTDLGVAVDFATKDRSLAIVVPDPAILQADVAYGVKPDIDPQSLQALNIAIKISIATNEIAREFAKVGYRDVDQLGDLRMPQAG